MVMKFAGVPDIDKLERELRDRLDALISIGEETNRHLLFVSDQLAALLARDSEAPGNVRGIFGEMERKRNV